MSFTVSWQQKCPDLVVDVCGFKLLVHWVFCKRRKAEEGSGNLQFTSRPVCAHHPLSSACFYGVRILKTLQSAEVCEIGDAPAGFTLTCGGISISLTSRNEKW